MSTPRQLIKTRSGLGEFMKYLVAFVPHKENWCVFALKEKFIVAENLTEEKAKELAHGLNTMEFFQREKEKIPAKLSFDFESIYNVYPRKIGRTKGLAICEKTIKTAQEYSLLASAVKNYAYFCESQRTETKYIKHFSSFMNCWKDWIPEDYVGEETTQLSIEELSSLVPN